MPPQTDPASRAAARVEFLSRQLSSARTSDEDDDSSTLERNPTAAGASTFPSSSPPPQEYPSTPRPRNCYFFVFSFLLYILPKKKEKKDSHSDMIRTHINREAPFPPRQLSEKERERERERDARTQPTTTSGREPSSPDTCPPSHA